MTPAHVGPTKQADFLENRAKAKPATRNPTVESVPDEDDIDYAGSEYSSDESDFFENEESSDFH
jgi:hypothetical protein